MAGPTFSIEGIVLNREPAGEKFVRLSLFSAERGVVTCLLRLPGPRPSATASYQPDLFDDAQLVVETPTGGSIGFVKEARLVERRSDLARSYEALTRACAFAKLLLRNPLHDDSRPAVYRLLHEALAAWSTGERPEIVAIKTLYRLARDEGYPVKQEWWTELPTSERVAAAEALNQPLAEQTIDPPTARTLLASLESYLENRADLIVR
jgi:recombinational DNA repair protein (RecF pathway)